MLQFVIQVNSVNAFLNAINTITDCDRKIKPSFNIQHSVVIMSLKGHKCKHKPMNGNDSEIMR